MIDVTLKTNKVILYIATSSDGYIADANGGVDWLPGPSNNIEDEFGYQALLDRIRTIVMGSRSYKQILTFGAWAWQDKQSYVFTSKIRHDETNKIKFYSGDVKTFIDTLPQTSGDIWLLGGAELIRSFAKAKLIDECIITIIPKALGNGIKLDLPYSDFILQKIIRCSGDIEQKFYIQKQNN